MTILDEPDEDADSLDDESLLDNLLAPDAPKQVAKAGFEAEMADWPPLMANASDVILASETLSWFKANHVDWFSQMEAVLRAWVTACKETSGPEAEQPQADL